MRATYPLPSETAVRTAIAVVRLNDLTPSAWHNFIFGDVEVSPAHPATNKYLSGWSNRRVKNGDHILDGGMVDLMAHLCDTDWHVIGWTATNKVKLSNFGRDQRPAYVNSNTRLGKMSIAEAYISDLPLSPVELVAVSNQLKSKWGL